jgi:hypothetical protein
MVEHVTDVDVSRTDQTATITMDKHVPLASLQKALDPKYQINVSNHNEVLEQGKSWLLTYRPILLIFLYIIGVTLLVQVFNNPFDMTEWMRHFMAGFFLVFSFFKMLDLKGFADSYVMYDVIARKIPQWAYVYAFVELALAVAYLTNFRPAITNTITALVMSVSIIGVLQTVLNKRAIRCACLGAVFNLPMSSVTIIEDGLMIIMSLVMLAML